MSIALLKRLVTGQDFQLKSSATCLYLFEKVGEKIRPEQFNPLIPITGGMSLLALDSPMSSAVFAANDWIYSCLRTGATAKNAIISIAANFDELPGMVSFALEIAQIAQKDSKGGRLLEVNDYFDIVCALYFRDWGGIYGLMSVTWGVVLNDPSDLPPSPACDRRSEIAKSLGHDVLIHPISLKPCADEHGILDFKGVETVGDDAFFTFQNKIGNVVRVPDLQADIAL